MMRAFFTLATLCTVVNGGGVHIKLDGVLTGQPQRNNGIAAAEADAPLYAFAATPRKPVAAVASKRLPVQAVENLMPTPTTCHPSPTEAVVHVAAKAPQPTPVPKPDLRPLEDRIVLSPLITPAAGRPQAEDLIVDLSYNAHKHAAVPNARPAPTAAPTPVAFRYDASRSQAGDALNDYAYGGAAQLQGQQQKHYYTSQQQSRERKDDRPPPPKPGDRPIPPPMKVRETIYPAP